VTNKPKSPRLSTVKALTAGDTPQVRALMELHIADGADRLIETLAQRGVWAKEVEPAPRQPPAVRSLHGIACRIGHFHDELAR
jgi:hypothetical protein